MAILKDREYTFRNPTTGKMYFIVNPRNKKVYALTLNFFMHNHVLSDIDLGFVKIYKQRSRDLGQVTLLPEEYKDFGRV